MKVQLDPQQQDAKSYQDLRPGKVYEIIGIEADDLRLLNDEGKPFLYPRNLFVIVDPDEGPDWETDYGDEGERYSYPRELKHPGFFEDYFDGDETAVATLRQYLAARGMAHAS